jgi:cell division transport system ATP-binding protein
MRKFIDKIIYENIDKERKIRHDVEVTKVGILTGSDNVIEMHDIWKTYPDGTTALQGINVVIDRNEFVYIVGPSGAGKSTFMKLIYREEVPTKGQISVNGFNIGKLKHRKIPYVRRNIGVIFQDYKLLPKLSAYENVAFAMEVIETPRRTIRRRTMEVLDLVGLKHKANSLPAQLSGGEQQRVAIARAIVNSPAVIVADEPTGNLDPETSWGIMNLLEEINFRGTTIVMATHNKEIVNTLRKRVIAIENGIISRDQQRGEYGYEI